MKKISLLIILFIFSMTFICCKEKVTGSIQIVYYPRCQDETVKIIIYDNESEEFTNLLIKKISRAIVDPFYVPCKSILDEGWYIIYLTTDGNIQSYELDSYGFIYDVESKKNLRSNILSDIYAYLAKKYLNQIAEEEFR